VHWAGTAYCVLYCGVSAQYVAEAAAAGRGSQTTLFKCAPTLDLLHRMDDWQSRRPAQNMLCDIPCQSVDSTKDGLKVFVKFVAQAIDMHSYEYDRALHRNVTVPV
jgi:hypothetical protein